MSKFVEEEKAILAEYIEKINSSMDLIKEEEVKKQLKGYFNSFIAELNENTSINDKPFNDII